MVLLLTGKSYIRVVLTPLITEVKGHPALAAWDIINKPEDMLKVGEISFTLHNKVLSGFKAFRQAGALMAGLEPATEGSLQISGRTHKPLCHRRRRPF
ncbi:endo-1,4-beta-mannanase 2 [Plakobranchus ocellatus]|uniref:Endo-1,4-beta-mannanase 2 n=1 Tax=Plakobranchus ocellatus TaxID=259542 RepID=A0AAV4CM58_9GAST|nr:endo-1,4-beta-mannanase 2 [Plakobranchus ocellatus]